MFRRFIVGAALCVLATEERAAAVRPGHRALPEGAGPAGATDAPPVFGSRRSWMLAGSASWWSNDCVEGPWLECEDMSWLAVGPIGGRFVADRVLLGGQVNWASMTAESGASSVERTSLVVAAAPGYFRPLGHDLHLYGQALLGLIRGGFEYHRQAAETIRGSGTGLYYGAGGGIVLTIGGLRGALVGAGLQYDGSWLTLESEGDDEVDVGHGALRLTTWLGLYL